ncbi:transglutaminase domain-containing protein [Thermococcus sp.]|uniref:transglutaminase domain-containing protein n=1 Tax=Thermococcus sp. TaxID=35749 RepID=UPI00262E8154|nr:transglutaminase domain-containing protein [Thermococcus sp.]
MGMRKVLPILLVLIVLASGCLFRPPAEVKFSIDNTAVPPGGTFHLIVTVNNTGKVGLVGATLILGNDGFQIVQEPSFPEILKVGQSVQLVWIIRAPEKPGTYNLQVSLELRDELKRTWTGFYGNFRITVSKEALLPERLLLNVTAPKNVNGGSTFTATVTIKNEFKSPVQLLNASFTLLPGMKVVSAPTLPPQLEPDKSATLRYTIRAPFASRNGFVTYLIRYFTGGSFGSVAGSFRVMVTWKPWEANDETLFKAYGKEYHWIVDSYIVDEYWVKKFNSTSYFDRKNLKPLALRVIGNATSDVDAAERVFHWILSNYSLGDITTTLQPDRILPQDRISYIEAQILATAMLRSLNIPARIVSLFNGTDCTIRPVTEFYTSDGWYIIDFKHGFIGSLDDYLASPYFPRVYQLVTRDHYRIVAQSPIALKGHEHVDVTNEFLGNLEGRLMNRVLERVSPTLRSKVTLALSEMPPGERIFALFIFSSAPNESDLNRILGEWSVDKIEKTVQAVYDFYKNMPWKDNFTYYWKIFAGEVP